MGLQRYIAFLSGLPGGSRAIPMETLRRLFMKLGFLGVETYLTTGNVAFLTAPVGITPPLEAQVSRHLERSTGERIGIFIRTPDELADIATHAAFAKEKEEIPEAAMFVILLGKEASEKATRHLRVRRNEVDRFHVDRREIYWMRLPEPGGASTPPLPLSEILEVPATVRSLGTIKRLAEQYGGDAREGRSSQPGRIKERAEIPTESEQSRQ